MVSKTVPELERLVCDVLVAVGADQANAEAVAEHLERAANLVGFKI
jgi:LDH2 family malate/lactate/ureidoglycolate dehydrogenase